MHVPPLLAILVVSLSLAFAFGLAARALRLPPLIGYLVAGAVVGPHALGFAADAGFTATLAEVGVGLLLFGVGLHFRPQDLAAVWRIALPGAVLQVAVGGLLGGLLGHALLGLSVGGACVFGLSLAIASTAVATRALEERGRLAGEAGRLALGWLVVQDLIVVLGLVLLPAASGGAGGGGAGGGGGGDLGLALLQALAELAAFVGIMLLAGRRFLPWALRLVARTGSRELFTLAVVVAALGIALSAAALFHVSFALGAFFAGVVLGESDLGHQAAAETVPLQRVFAAIFFFSVGTLMDAGSVAAAPVTAVAAIAVVLLGTGLATFLLLLALRVPPATAAVVAPALAQIGEFSFVLVELGIGSGILPDAARGPVLLGSFSAILLTPVSFRVSALLAGRLEECRALGRWQRSRNAQGQVPPVPGLRDHAILVGYGRVGHTIAAALLRHGLPLVVIEGDRHIADALRQAATLPVIWGDAAREEVLAAANPAAARLLILALPGAWEARRVMALARAANPAIGIAVRTHDDGEIAWLREVAGVDLAVMGEREVALGMADFAMQRLGVSAATAQATVDSLRARMPGETEKLAEEAA
jgi:CPA2 family monovalent cation:H+ antiporter-2